MATTSKSGPDRGRLTEILDRPVTLVGMMGSGKTIIGKKLATAELLCKRTIVIWLRAEPETLLGRIGSTGSRPLLHGDDPLGMLNQLAAERENDYGKAHITIKTDGLSAWSTTLTVLSALDTYLVVK